MPKLPKGFGRRKSTANALEELENSPATAAPSFRVFERPREPNKSFDGGMTFSRTQTAPLPPRKNTPTQPREDNMFEDLKYNRGSGASNTNTASTTDNSSRLSAASTAPSSTSHQSTNDHRSPHDKPYPNIPVPPVPRHTSSGFLRGTGRTFSFGRGKSTPSPSRALDETPSPVTPEDTNSVRQRTVTSSSYASTATPPKLDDKNLALSLGGDFGDMFSGFGKRKSVALDMDVNRLSSNSPDYLQPGPSVPERSYAPARQNQPSPLTIDRTKEVEASPYSWSSQRSNEGLMANSSPLYPPAVPRHGSPQLSTSSNNASPSTRVARNVPSGDGLRRASGLAGRRPSTFEQDETESEDTRFLKESVGVIQRFTGEATPARARDSWLVPSATPSTGSSFNEKPSGTSGWRRDPPTTTRKPVNISNDNEEDNMFAQAGSSNAMAQRNIRATTATASPQSNGVSNKVMTPAQFERYRQDQVRQASSSTLPKDVENEEDAYEEDDEDEAEKQKQIAKQRRKQEAHMAVYRQQMMKVTGEALPPPSSRPSMSFSMSTPNLGRVGSTSPEEEEEDEEVPLAILAAHGFPNKNRLPSQLSSMHSNPNLRASSQMGSYAQPSAAGGSVAGGRLPVFARNLPQDPYFGAGLVNPSNRESLAFGTGTGSVLGSGPVGPPGGLVGVIATEERSRAMRRGSPNPAGGYGAPPPPSNGFNGMGMPMMGNMNGMPPMPMFTPGEHAQFEMQQMQQQMQQFMQLQMQFMQMQLNPSQGSQIRPQSQSGAAPQFNRASTLDPGLQPGFSHQRAMSMMDNNAAPWLQPNVQRNTMFAPSIHVPGNQYTPSIAPSERSNVGLPGRYRPVSTHPGMDNRSRTATMSGALQDWSDGKQSSVTVKAVKKTENVSDEDDEEGWAAMKQKREKKKSKWRSKKNESGLNDIVGYVS